MKQGYLRTCCIYSKVRKKKEITHHVYFYIFTTVKRMLKGKITSSTILFQADKIMLNLTFLSLGLKL